MNKFTLEWCLLDDSKQINQNETFLEVLHLSKSGDCIHWSSRAAQFLLNLSTNCIEPLYSQLAFKFALYFVYLSFWDASYYFMRVHALIKLECQAVVIKKPLKRIEPVTSRSRSSRSDRYAITTAHQTGS